MALTQNYIKLISFMPMADEFFIEKLQSKEKTESVTIENAYYKIKDVKGSKVKVDIKLGIYETQNGKLLEFRDYTFTPSVEEGSENFIKQGYEYLKTLDEFKDAEDC